MQVRTREREDAEKAYTRKLGQAFAAAHGVESVSELFGPRSISHDEVAAYISSGMFPHTTSAVASASAGGGHGAVRAAPLGGVVAAAVSAGVELACEVTLPSAFRRGGDSGVIRSVKEVDTRSPYYTSPYPIERVSAARPPFRYIAELDPFELALGHEELAAELQHIFPRYFMLAAKYDLHAAAIKDPSAASTIASSSANVRGRSDIGSTQL